MMNDQDKIKLYRTSHGEGKPIIALHGLGLNLYSWRNLISPLAGQFQLILVDLKGHGRSPKPKDGRYSIQDQVDLQYEFIRKNNFRELILIGNSLGGGIALRLAIRLIEESQNRLAGLVLIDSVAFQQKFPFFLRIVKMPILGRLVLSLLSATFIYRIGLWFAYFDRQKITTEAIQQYAYNLTQPGGVDALIESTRQLVPPDLENIIAKYHLIQVPTLLIWGKEDGIVPLEVGNKLHARIANSELLLIERCGHLPHEERPEATIKAITEFVRRAFDTARERAR
jgi:pimeloyl-ACP methyl ester carboxylesterase